MPDLVAWASQTWPDGDWSGSEPRHRAFHEVLVPPQSSVVLRVTTGREHHARAVHECAALDLFADVLPLQVPRRTSEPVPCLPTGSIADHPGLERRRRADDTGAAVSLIDADHACLGAAIDVAPLGGSFGAAAVAAIVDPELLRRAMIHRASLPLQVAVAARLVV